MYANRNLLIVWTDLDFHLLQKCVLWAVHHICIDLKRSCWVVNHTDTRRQISEVSEPEIHIKNCDEKYIYIYIYIWSAGIVPCSFTLPVIGL